MRGHSILAVMSVFSACVSLMAQDGDKLESAAGKAGVVKDLVQGSIHHRPHGKQVEWERVTGKAQVISPTALLLADGTPIELGCAPDLDASAAQTATDFLHKLVDDEPVTSFGYVGDTNLQHAMIINGWGLADHSSLHPAEVIAREGNRGCWRGPRVVSGKKPQEQTNVVKDRVKGSSHHDKGLREWDRITGTARVIDAHTLEFADGTRILLHVIAPDLEQKGRIGDSFYPCGKEAAEFLRKLIGDQPVMAFLVEAQDDKWIAYAGDANLGHALVINGWGLAHHSSLHPAEITAREKKRGLWRGEFLDPDEWRAGKRLPGEK